MRVVATAAVRDQGRPVLFAERSRGVLLLAAAEGDLAGQEEVDLDALAAADPALGELSGLLPAGFFADRAAPDEPWRRHHRHGHAHEGEDEERARIAEQIAEKGWYCINVVPTEEDRAKGDQAPGFAYTVGLRDTFGHPDLLVSGMPHETGYDVLLTAVDRLGEGCRYRPGDESAEVLEGYDVLFVGIPDGPRRDLMTTTDWYYEREPFGALQVVWPDRDRRWPWDPDSAAGPQQVLLDEDPGWDDDATEPGAWVRGFGFAWVHGADADLTFTVGLEHTYGHPDLVTDAGRGGPDLLLPLAERVRDGERLDLEHAPEPEARAWAKDVRDRYGVRAERLLVVPAGGRGFRLGRALGRGPRTALRAVRATRSRRAP